jgi:hypothetical protein
MSLPNYEIEKLLDENGNETGVVVLKTLTEEKFFYTVDEAMDYIRYNNNKELQRRRRAMPDHEL